MPDVNLVAVQNKTDRHYFIGDVEVAPGATARVDGDSEFLRILVGRGDFDRYDTPSKDEDKASDPEVVQPEAEADKPAPQTKKQARGAQPSTEGEN